MPTPTKGPRLGGGPAHERLMLAGLATQLFEHRSITTTEAKAKRLRPLAERLVTFAKRGDLASRRRVMTTVRDKGVVHELFTEIAPAVADRQGGYTRIIKIGPRKGDNAPMAVIELVLEPVASATKEATAATARASRGNTAAAPAAPAAPATEETLPADTGEDTPAEIAGTEATADTTTADTTTADTTTADTTTTDEAPTGAPAGVAGTTDDPAVTGGTDTPDAPAAPKA